MQSVHVSTLTVAPFFTKHPCGQWVRETALYSNTGALVAILPDYCQQPRKQTHTQVNGQLYRLAY